MPDTSEVSIPCWVMDHDECSVPMLCKCTCHHDALDIEPPDSDPLSNR
jgi:hypothetical protein